MVLFIKDFIKAQKTYQVSRASSSLAYYMVFSFFPLLIFLNSVLGMINLSIKDIEEFLYFLPDNILSMMVEYNTYLVQSDNLYSLIFSAFLVLFSFTRSINSLYYSLNFIFEVPVPKTTLVKSGFLTTSLMLSVYMVLFLTVVGDFIINYLTRFFEISILFLNIILIARYLIAATYVFIIVVLMYKLIPNIKLKFSDCIVGSIVAIAGIFISSLLFSIYVLRFSNYSLIYGSLSAVMFLILWLYICSMVIIEGCIINKLLFTRKHG